MSTGEEDGTTGGFSTATERLIRAGPRRQPPPIPALTVLCHPDLERVGDRVLLGEVAAGREALLSRHQPHFAAPGSARGRPLADSFLSREPLRLEALTDGGVRIHRRGCRADLEIDGAAVARVSVHEQLPAVDSSCRTAFLVASEAASSRRTGSAVTLG